MKKHAFEYQHDGVAWIIEVRADSKEDAEQRIQRMQYATYLGEVELTIPTRTGNPWLVKMICWWRNIFAR